MTRFASVLLCVLATASSVSEALRIPDSLQNVVNKETNRIPTLRTKEMERKNVLQNKLAGIAVNPDKQTKRRLEDNNGYGADYQWDEFMDAESIGFDITNYAVKYTQCATVQTYSDDLAADENIDTVLAAKRFAIFRLCPKDQCSSYSNSGCGSNYGEYLVSLDQFLLAMMEYQESRVAGYCEYCQNCATIEAAKLFWKDVYSTRTYALESAQESYQTWYTNYLESMYANGYKNNNYQNNGNGNDDKYQQVDANTAAQQYYQQIRESNNYANKYAQNNYGSSSGSSYSSGGSSSGSSSGSSYNYNSGGGNQYQWSNQDMWQSQSKVSSNSAQWSNMGNPGASFYGHQICNGYYDNGQFVQEYGYFNDDGDFVSLEDEEITWDESLWGEEPDGWDDVTVDTESCSYKYAGSCYNQYDACMQILQDEDYYVATNGYQNANGQQKATLKDFLGCVEVDPNANNNANNGYASQQAYYQNAQYNQQAQQYSYIGPNCGSNGRDISLAVYKDQYCSVVDTSKKVADVLGYSPYSSSIDLFPSECMNCLEDEEYQAWYEDEEVFDLEPMCSMLYQYAGKCNKHLAATEYNYASYTANANYQYQNQDQGDAAQGDEANAVDYADNEWKQMYQSENQAQNENAVCSFIESLTSNSYDENGEINVSGSTWASPSAWNREFAAESKAMSGGMKAALVLTALATVAMAVAVCVLHGTLARKNIPWKPRRSKGQDPTDLARQNSGITMGRSRSGPGNNPLL